MRTALHIIGVIGVLLCAGGLSAEPRPGASSPFALTHLYLGVPVAWHESLCPVSGGCTLIVSRLDYLISDVRLERPDGSSAAFPDQYFLISGAEGKTTMTLQGVPQGPWKSISFTVGVDEKTNHADPARWPSGHALNVLDNNLHWGWKGGYVFLAAEGRIMGPAGSPAAFLYHLGGNSNRTRVRAAFATPPADLTGAELVFHVDRLWNAVSPIRVHDNEIITHSSEGDGLAPRLSRNLERCFEVKIHGR